MIRDDLRPVHEKAYDADVIILGSPVYLSNPTGATKSFLERLVYPLLSYNPKANEKGEMESGIREKRVPNAIIYTSIRQGMCLESVIINFPILRVTML